MKGAKEEWDEPQIFSRTHKMPTKVNEFAGKWLESRDMQKDSDWNSRTVNTESRFMWLNFEVWQRTKVDSSSSSCCSMYSAIETMIFKDFPSRQSSSRPLPTLLRSSDVQRRTVAPVVILRPRSKQWNRSFLLCSTEQWLFLWNIVTVESAELQLFPWMCNYSIFEV